MSLRGKIVRLKRGQLVFIGGMAVYARDGKVDLCVYGEGEIIMPHLTRDHGPFDTKEAIEKVWREVHGNKVDEKDLQGAGGSGCDDLSYSGEQDATSGLAG